MKEEFNKEVKILMDKQPNTGEGKEHTSNKKDIHCGESHQ